MNRTLGLENVRSEAGGSVILDMPKFSVASGCTLAILGRNGAGKSTLLRVLAGLSRPVAGTVTFTGPDGVARRNEEARSALRLHTAFVFQNPFLWTGTVRRNLEAGLRFRHLPRDEVARRVDAIAGQLEIESYLDRNVGALSGGEVQRVALARALVLDPEILFLDEPSSNLDAESHAALREDLDRVARGRARTIVMATHERPDAFYLADRIAVLRDGRLVQDGTPAELFENPVDPFIAGITGAELSIPGTVEAADRELLQVDVGGTVITAVGRAGTGDRVKIAYRPEDLFLSSARTSGGSARNSLRLTVAEIRSLGALVRIRLAGPTELVAVVTRAAAAELELAPGAEVWVQIKATALHAFVVGTRRTDSPVQGTGASSS